MQRKENFVGILAHSHETDDMFELPPNTNLLMYGVRKPLTLVPYPVWNILKKNIHRYDKILKEFKPDESVVYFKKQQEDVLVQEHRVFFDPDDPIWRLGVFRSLNKTDKGTMHSYIYSSTSHTSPLQIHGEEVIIKERTCIPNTIEPLLNTGNFYLSDLISLIRSLYSDDTVLTIVFWGCRGTVEQQRMFFQDMNLPTSIDDPGDFLLQDVANYNNSMIVYEDGILQLISNGIVYARCFFEMVQGEYPMAVIKDVEYLSSNDFLTMVQLLKAQLLTRFPMFILVVEVMDNNTELNEWISMEQFQKWEEEMSDVSSTYYKYINY